MHNKLKEFEHDFNEIAEKINEKGYNPSNSEFQKALSIGLMALVMREMRKDEEEVLSDDYDHAKAELNDAEEYLEEYLETKDPTAKTIAGQELNHSKFWLDKIRLSHKTPAEQTRYKSLLDWHNDIMDRLNK